MNRPACVYMVYKTDDEQGWIPCFYEVDNAMNKAVELIKEMGYPEEKIYSNADGGGGIHFFIEGVIDPEDPEDVDIEPVYIVEYSVEDC